MVLGENNGKHTQTHLEIVLPRAGLKGVKGAAAQSPHSFRSPAKSKQVTLTITGDRQQGP